MNETIMIPENFAVDEATVLRERMLNMVQNGKKDLLLDFSRCSFIDSTGLGVLVSIYKRTCENRGTFKLQGVNENVMKIFKLTRLDKVFEINN